MFYFLKTCKVKHVKRKKNEYLASILEVELFKILKTNTRMEKLLCKILQGLGSKLAEDVIYYIARFLPNRYTCITCDPRELFREAVLNPRASPQILAIRVRYSDLYCTSCEIAGFHEASGYMLSRDVMAIVLGYYSSWKSCLRCDSGDTGKKLLKKSRVESEIFICHDCDICHVCNLQIRCGSFRCPCRRNHNGCNCE